MTTHEQSAPMAFTPPAAPAAQRWRVTGAGESVVFAVETPFDLDDPTTFEKVAALARLTRRITGVQRIEVESPDGWREVLRGS